jgi:hypothetical protein
LNAAPLVKLLSARIAARRVDGQPEWAGGVVPAGEDLGLGADGVGVGVGVGVTGSIRGSPCG